MEPPTQSVRGERTAVDSLNRVREYASEGVGARAHKRTRDREPPGLARRKDKEGRRRHGRRVRPRASRGLVSARVLGKVRGRWTSIQSGQADLCDVLCFLVSDKNPIVDSFIE